MAEGIQYGVVTAQGIPRDLIYMTDTGIPCVIGLYGIKDDTDVFEAAPMYWGADQEIRLKWLPADLPYEDWVP